MATYSDTEEASLLLSLQDWRLRSEIFACKTVLRVRTGQLFAIVLDFPESQPAVEDLRECVGATGNKQLVVAAYSEALSARLLTAGASTADILQQYARDHPSAAGAGPFWVSFFSATELLSQPLQAALPSDLRLPLSSTLAPVTVAR